MEEKKTKLTLEIDSTVTTWEVPYDDCSVEDIIYGLYGIMVAQTFQPGSIANCMKEFGEDQLEAISYAPKLFSTTNENQDIDLE